MPKGNPTPYAIRHTEEIARMVTPGLYRDASVLMRSQEPAAWEQAATLFQEARDNCLLTARVLRERQEMEAARLENAKRLREFQDYLDLRERTRAFHARVNPDSLAASILLVALARQERKGGA